PCCSMALRKEPAAMLMKSEHAGRSGAGVWGPTILLTVAFTWSYVDRHIFSLLVEPIKASLAISDARIGLIHGISFSLFTVIATLPLAWLADRGNRPRLIGWCIAGWSVMTMACGL